MRWSEAGLGTVHLDTVAGTDRLRRPAGGSCCEAEIGMVTAYVGDY